MRDFEFLCTNSNTYLNKKLYVEGCIPKNISGNLYRIGAHQFELFDKPHNHWFDADAGVVKINFNDGIACASINNLNLTTDVESEKKDFVLGRFGRAPKSLLRRVKAIWDHSQYANSANTSLFKYRHKLYALYEASFPVEIDPGNLKVIKIEDFDVLKRAFSAHPKLNPKKDAYYNFGFRFHPRPSLDIFKLPLNGHPEHIGSLLYNGSSFVHDFAVSENYVVFVISPVFASPIDLIVKGKSISQSLKFKKKQKTIIKVAKLDHLEESFEIETDPMLYTHTVNCYESKNSIILEGVTYEDGKNLKWINSVKRGEEAFNSSTSRLTKFKINPEKRTVETTFSRLNIEVPTVPESKLTQKHRFIYAAAHHSSDKNNSGLYKSIKRIDRETGEVKSLYEGPNQIMSEPIFIPSQNGDEENGYVISLNHDMESGKSYCAFSNFQKEPVVVAKAWFDHHIPFTFHGLWEAHL
jgi:all-trans-8'-apo-beta-carotenal 15,15'-oxygenase